MRRLEAGFTLIETLVSLAIFSLISALILGVVTLQGRAEESVRHQIDKDESIIQAQAVLRARMDGMRAIPDNHGAGDWVLFDGEPSRLAFDAPVFMAEGPHALHHYRLELARSGDLMLYYINGRSVIDWRLPGTEGWGALRLLQGVTRVNLTYFGPDRFTGQDSWQESWSRRRGLPKLISVRVAFAPGDTRQWPVLLVRPSPQTRLPCRDDNTGKDCGDTT